MKKNHPLRDCTNIVLKNQFVDWARGVGFVCVVLSVAAPRTFAQVLEEVIVTAQKRDQSVQDVGISITAISGNQIETFGFSNAQQVVDMVPGVNAVTTLAEGSYSLAIRGAANSDFTANIESPVAVYVDEAYISQMTGTGFMLYDLERVEILRGPQGTLFGRNATGGLAHYITVKPSEELSGYAKLTGGEYGQIRSEGAIGGGLSDSISGRLSVSTHHNDGYAENRLLDKDLANADDYAGRVQLLFEPNEDVEFLFKAHYAVSNVRSGFYESWPALTGGVLNPAGTYNPILDYTDPDLNKDPYAGDYDREGFNDTEIYGFTGNLKWELGNVNLTSISDYQNVTRDFLEDTDSSPSPAFNFFSGTDAAQFSQELRLDGETDKFKWVTGLYYIDIDVDDTNGFESNLYADFLVDPTLLTPDDAPYFDIGCCRGIGTGYERGVDNPYSIDTSSWSIFGQIDYAINDNWNAILGFRWIEEEKDYMLTTNIVRFIPGSKWRNGNPNIIQTVQVLEDSSSDGMWAAKAELDWRPNDDLLLYASWNRGTKAGGFNAPIFPPAQAFDEVIPYGPEKLDAFELGFKWTFADGLARLNTSGYYYDYNGYQAYELIVLDVFTSNRQAEMHGFEAELQASPLDGLDLLFGVAYNDADVEVVGRTATPVKSPEWMLNGLIRYEWPMFGGNMSLQGDANYRSKQYSALTNLDSVTEGGNTIVNVRAGWTTADGKWDFSVSVDNLFDNNYVVQSFDTSGAIFANVVQIYNRPRWVSGSVSYRF